MNEDQIAGMRARSSGRTRETCQLSGTRKLEWIVGFDMMEVHIEQYLRNATTMVTSMAEVKKRNGKFAYAAV